ncbi:MAG: glycosyltransferase family 4 protein [Candidatus Gastranaerophilales bacterium]|nr:glycosyltransferase family 4 protein [Candidatus Gastranaerophilales bacterium]
MTKNIAYINHTFEDNAFSSGGEKVNFQILKALIENFEVDIYFVNNKLEGDYNIKNFYQMPEENFLQNALQIANSKNYDATISTNFAIPTDIVYLHEHSRAYREKIVKTPFENLISSIFSAKRHKRSQFEMEAQKELISQYNVILTPSSVLKNDLINLLGADGKNIYILPPCIDNTLENIEPQSEKRVFTFGLIARGFDNKGGYIFLNALGRLKKYNPKFRAKIIYPYEKTGLFLRLYLKLFGLENRVEFIKYQPDMNNFYTNIDCLVMPSKRETFGLGTLEAMSFGKIVVISSRCGAKDIIEHNKNGFVFDITKKPDKNLANVLKDILDKQNDLDNLKMAALYTAKEYNFEKFKSELERIINNFSRTKQEDSDIE